MQAERQMVKVTDSDIYYLRSIQRQLTSFKEMLADTAQFSLAGLAYADNLEWLDCFIDQHTRAASSVSSLRKDTGG